MYFSVSNAKGGMMNTPRPRYRDICLLSDVLTGLVGNAAGSLAGRLAGSLAFAAAALRTDEVAGG